MQTLEEAIQATAWTEGFVCSEAARKPSKSELAQIQQYMRCDAKEGDVYTFPALAIDETPTRNGVIYSADSQRKTLKAWNGIPFLFNASAQGGIFSGPDHALQAASQFGRIYKSQLVETEKGKVGTLVWVYTVPSVSEEVAEFANKIDTGILREVSIHVMAEQVECSICGKQFYEDGHDHLPMEKYGKETAYIKTVGALTPLELSSVACPGSTVARVMLDDEAADLKILPLREALGGSQSAIEAFMEKKKAASDAPADDKKDQQEQEPVEAVDGKAPKPGKGKSKDGSGSEDADECNHSADEECASCESKTKDPDADDSNDKNDTGKPVGKQKAKESLNLFEGKDCPVCHRADSSAETLTETQRAQVVAEYVEEIQLQITSIVEATDAKIAEALEEKDHFKKLAESAEVMLTHFVEETADLAISRGLKEVAQRDSYTKELFALGFNGVKALHETIKASNFVPTRQEQIKKLEETHRKQPARFVQTPPKKKSDSRFAATLGPTN